VPLHNSFYLDLLQEFSQERCRCKVEKTLLNVRKVLHHLTISALFSINLSNEVNIWT